MEVGFEQVECINRLACKIVGCNWGLSQVAGVFGKVTVARASGQLKAVIALQA